MSDRPIDPRTGRPRQPSKTAKSGQPPRQSTSEPRKGSGQQPRQNTGEQRKSSSQPPRQPSSEPRKSSSQPPRQPSGEQRKSSSQPRPNAQGPRKTAVRQLPPRPVPAPAPAKPRPPAPRQATLKMGSPRRRLRITMFALLFTFSLFAGRLFQLQAVDEKDYAKAANTDREATATLWAERGAILAADGTPLAVSVEAYDITADPTKVAKYHEDVDELSAKLAGLLSAAPEYADGGAPSASDLRAKLSESDKHYVLLARKASPETCAKVRQLAVSNTYNPKTVVGVFTKDRDDRRTYPGGTLGANLVGFTGGDGVGRAGIEQMLNGRLAGVDGHESFQAAAGVEIPTAGVNLKPAVDGSTLKTTIDPDIQWAADQALSDEIRKTGSKSGTAVVLDVKTGQILALANYPTFDPRHIAQSDVPNLGNRAFTEPFEPGSVAKVITMAAAIQEGVATPSTQVPPFTSPMRVGHWEANDDIPHGAWQLTMTGVLAKSSNIGTIEVADLFAQHGLDRDQTIYKYQRLFGFGAKTGIGFPGETGGLLDPPQKWSDTQRYTVLYGQGLSSTAIQDASVYQTIANGGLRIAPTLVQGWTDPAGKYTPAPAAQQTQVISADTATQMAQMLESVVANENGTGTTAQIPGYRVSGKTGTANRYDDVTHGYKGYTASFIGFAPTDNPQLVVAVSVQDPPDQTHFGSQVAAPVFTKVMEFALQSRGVAPTGTKPSDLPVKY